MKHSAATKVIFNDLIERLNRRSDRSFLYLFGLQWLVTVIVTLFYSGTTWSGTQSSLHPHVWIALFAPGILFSLPAYLVFAHSQLALTRHTIAVAQMLFAALFIHLLDGRIEAHFLIFGSLAFLAFYRDWKVLITASAVASLDHMIRGYVNPASIYGLDIVEPYRWLEHFSWIVFEDAFLVYSCIQGREAILIQSDRQAALEATNASIEEQIEKRTAELKAAYVELDAQRAHSLQSSKMAALGQMAGGIAHEINTPLGTLQLLTSQLSIIETKDPAQKVLLERIRERIDSIVGRIAGSITALRNFAKEGSNEAFAINEVDQLVAGSVELWRGKIAAAGIDLEISSDNDLQLDCKPTQIKQVLFSLLSNSYDAVLNGAVKKIRLEAYAKDKFVYFVIEDYGSGVADMNRNKIFEPFFTSKDIGLGTGLGLSVALSIAESHGGTLKLDHLAQPTRFILTLPKIKRKDVA